MCPPAEVARAEEPSPSHEAISLRVSGHISLGVKPDIVLDRLCAQGFAGLQLHASSPRTWRTPSREPTQLEDLRQRIASRALELYIHAIYLINLGSTNEAIRTSSIRSLMWTLSTGTALGASAVVVHAGSHLGAGFDAVRPVIRDSLEKVLSATRNGSPWLLLENSAGGGGNIGCLVEELGHILEDAGRPHGLGVCIDTAHAFAAGYDLRSRAGSRNLAAAIDGSIGWDRVVLVHANDSKAELGSGRDRHENIGAGSIGETGFGNLLQIPELASLPWVLETPNPDKRPDDLASLRRAHIRSLEESSRW